MKTDGARILAVDDDPSIRRLLRSVLTPEFEFRGVASGEAALECLAAWQPDLVLLDIVMPGIDGYETCRRIKAGSRALPPQIVIVSGKSAAAEQILAFNVGADDYISKPIDPPELLARVKLHVRLRRSQVQTAELQQEIEENHLALRRAAEDRMEQVLALQDLAVFTLAKVAESRDQETGNHMTRLREYAQRLASELAARPPYARQIDDLFLSDLYHASPLHDIGKVGISDAILLKPGRLTADEFEAMKLHTVIGANILNEALTQARSGGFLRMAAVIAQFHHERWDGTGYPAGLLGDRIPLPARIVAVADVFDALLSERPYKRAWTPEAARDEILRGRGQHFDPGIVDAFLDCYDDLLRIREQHSDRTDLVVGAMGFVGGSPSCANLPSAATTPS